MSASRGPPETFKLPSAKADCKLFTAKPLASTTFSRDEPNESKTRTRHRKRTDLARHGAFGLMVRRSHGIFLPLQTMRGEPSATNAQSGRCLITAHSSSL